MQYRKKSPLFFFLIPAFFMMIVFLYYPFFRNILNSFFDMSSLVQTDAEFIGLDNYIYMFKDSRIHTALKNTFIIMAFTIIFQVGFALVLALMVDSIRIGNQFFRTTFFLPIVISATAIGLMFNLFYNYSGGMLNQMLALFGKEPFMWLGEKTALIMVSLPVIWQYIGFYFVIILTGINALSEDMFEAATIDGCTGLKKVFRITLPNLKGVLSTCLVLAITGSLKVFDLPWVIAPYGAPSGLTHFTGTYMYEMTFEIGNIDYGSTIAVLIVALGVVISQVTNRLLKEKES